jgi:putative FmdB family regulatory protein
MPMYEFECLDCKALFETIVRNADAVKDVTCRKCNSGNIKKVVSAGSFLSKGTVKPSGSCSPRAGFT